MLMSGPHRLRRLPKNSDALRSVKAGWIWNAGGRFATALTSLPVESMKPVLNRRSHVGLSTSGLPMTHTPFGAVMGTPDIQLICADNCQPAASRLTRPELLLSHGRPGPNGNS